MPRHSGERRQFVMQCARGFVAARRARVTRFQHHRVETGKQLRVGPLPEIRRQFRELIAPLAGAHFVEDSAQAEEIRAWRSGALRRNVAFGPHEGRFLTDIGHQPDVGEFGQSLDEDDIRGFDIPMHQVGAMEVGEGGAQRQSRRGCTPSVAMAPA